MELFLLQVVSEAPLGESNNKDGSFFLEWIQTLIDGWQTLIQHFHVF
jgi:hypothetical protein